MATKSKLSGFGSIEDMNVLVDRNKHKKVAVVVTYVIALLAMLAGLFAPLYGNAEAIADKIMFRYLPDMLNTCLFGAIGSKDLIPIGGWFLEYTPVKEPFGTVIFGIDYLAGLYVLYAVMCVIGIIMLIPVFAGNSNRNTSARCAFAVEIITSLLLTVAVFFVFIGYPGFRASGIVNIVLALFVTVAMAVVQSIVTKGGVGWARAITFVIIGLALISLFDIGGLWKRSAAVIDGFSANLGLGEHASLIALGSGEIIFGVNYLYEILPNIVEVFKGGDVYMIVAEVLVIALAALVMLNFLIDMIALCVGKKYNFDPETGDRTPVSNMGHNVFAIIRYLLTLIVAGVALALMLTVCKDYGTPGLYFYAILIAVGVEFIIACIVTAADGARAKQGTIPCETGEKSEAFTDDKDFAVKPVVEEPIPAPAPVPVYMQPAPAVTAEQPTPVEPNDIHAVTQAVDTPSYEPTPVIPSYAESAQNAPIEQPLPTAPAYEQPTLPVQQPEHVPAYEQPAAPAEQPAPAPAPVAYEQPAAPAEQPAPAPAPVAYEQPAPVAAETAQTTEPEQLSMLPKEEPQPVLHSLYNDQSGNEVQYSYKAVYNGPTDDFLDTLTDDEKIEFVQVFLQKTKGKLPAIPEYVIGGDNSAFFPAVFVRLNRFRSMISDGLLAKIYKRI